MLRDVLRQEVVDLGSGPVDAGIGGPPFIPGIAPGIDLTSILNQLNLAPQPLTSGPPPVDTSTLPTVGPLPIELPPALPTIGTPDLTGIFTAPQPTGPTGVAGNLPLIGAPVFTVTSTSTAPTSTITEPPPPITQPPPVTVTTAGGGGSVTVNVQVNNAENIANDVIQKLQEAVTQGIADSVQKASDIAASIFEKIGEVLKSIAQTIWDALRSALQAIASQIGQIVAGIGDALKNAAQYIFRGLATVFTDLKNVLVDVINRIGPILDSIAKHIQRINDTLIAPIANFINTTVRTIAALTVAIERDLHDGLAGIVRIPGDIAQGISSIDASLNRTVQQLGQYNRQVAVDTLFSTRGVSAGDSFAGIHESLIGLNPSGVTNTTFQVSDQLTEACDLPSIADAISKQFGDITPQSGILKDLYNMIRGVFLELSQVAAYFEKINEAAEETVDAKCPLKKVDPNSLVQAWMRSFITADQMDDEMRKQGFSPSRSKLLRDLSRYVESTQELSNYRYRDIISDDDFVAGLRDLGLTESQIAAYRQGTQQLLDPQTGQTAWLRKVIDDGTFAQLLKANRYDDTQVQLLQTLARRPPVTGEALGATHSREFLGGVFGTGYDWDAVPDYFTAAGRAEGLDDNTIRANWWVHFFTGDLQTWIGLYFRGIRTQSELTQFMNSRAVPQAFQNDLVEINRPLIPFRSIPTFVRAGVLSDARARSILQAHGFAIEDINAIMDSVATKSKTTKTAAANGILTLSIANAKTLFNDGAITQAQYESILEQHGYTAELAQAQSQVDTVNAHAKSRKATLSNYAAEVEAGVLSMDDAVQQLNQQGFTTPEIQTWQARVIHALRIGSHRVTLGELASYLKDGSITLDQYRAELINQGWQEPWLSAQVFHVTPK